MKRLIFLIALVLFAGIGWLVREGNATYARNQAADLAAISDTATATTRLNELKRYVIDHSGSSVKVVLSSLYEQALEAAQKASVTTPSASLYAEAQAACAGHNNSVQQAQCNEQYLQTHSGGGTTATTVAPPSLNDYTYTLTAPVVTFDAPSAFFALAFFSLVGLVLPSFKPKSYL